MHPPDDILRWLAELVPAESAVAVLGAPEFVPPTGQMRSPGHGLEWLIVFDALTQHLTPETQLLTWRNWLAPMGRLLVRVPNLRHFPNLLRLLGGHWPESDLSPEVHPLTAESVLHLFESTGWETLEVRAFHQAWPQQAAFREALCALSSDLTGFDADSVIAHFYILATPRASAEYPLPLPLEGLRTRNLLLPLTPDHSIRLKEYLTLIPAETDLAAILMPLAAHSAYEPEALLAWLASQRFDANHIPDLIIPEIHLGLEDAPAAMQTVSALVADETTPRELLEACRRQQKDLIWRADGPPPPGFSSDHVFIHWQEWL